MVSFLLINVFNLSNQIIITINAPELESVVYGKEQNSDMEQWSEEAQMSLSCSFMDFLSISEMHVLANLIYTSTFTI